MILVTQNEDKYEIRFPYDAELVQLVKNVPGRVWNPEQKFWSVPLARLGFFLAQVKGTKYEKDVRVQSNEDININASINEPNQIPDIDISDVTMYVKDGFQVFEHQKDTVRFAKWRYQNGLKSGFILADEPGLGKTLSVTLWAMYLKEHYNVKHCLIIACVNSAKYNWREDIIKHTNGKEIPYILGSRLKRNGEINLTGGSAEKLEDLTTMKQYGEKGTEPLPYFLILNIEAVRMRIKKKFPIVERLVELINNKEIGMIALDEIHRNCLTHDALIQTDCGLMQLGDIVENKLNVNVLSYDITTDSIVYKPVTNWHSVQVTSQLIEIVVEENQNLRVIRCTPNHEFYTRNRGWIAASDLTESDDIILADKEEFDDN